MPKARDIMTPGAEYVDVNESIANVAKKLASDDIGALPVCDGNKLKGMITDRDIVVQGLAAGKDLQSARVIDLIEEREVVTIGADDDLEVAIQTMGRAKVRRLPVIDGHDLVGVVSQADLARALPEDQAGKLIEVISS